MHFPSAENKRKFAVSVFRLQQTNRSSRFPLVPFSVYIFTETAADAYRDILNLSLQMMGDILVHSADGRST